MRRALLAAAAGALVLAGCGTPAPAPSPVPAPTAPVPTAPTPAGGAPEDVVCAEYRDSDSVLRRTADAVARMPVLPAGVNLVLLNTRMVAQTPGVQDPELVAAQTELVAAIDDLDAQGRALVGPEGSAVTDAVQYDAARITAAVTEIERVCARY